MVPTVGILEFGLLGVSTPHLVMVLFWYIVAIFVVTPHSFVTLHHHELVRPRLGRDFPHKQVYGLAGLLRYAGTVDVLHTAHLVNNWRFSFCHRHSSFLEALLQ